MKMAMDDYLGFHERMSRLREMEIGLDGAICAGGGEVRVHLPFMAACNQTLFNRITGLVKQGKTELKANKISLKGIQFIVDYCYTGEIEITEDNFEHIIDAALGLEFLNIVEQCIRFELTSDVNANIWCHFFRAAFKHPRSVQPNNFVPDLTLHNITKIPKEAIFEGLNAAYIREILEHGTFAEIQRNYSVNIFMGIILADSTEIKNFKDTIILLKDKLEPNDKLVLSCDVSVSKLMTLLDLALEVHSTSVVEACVAALEKSPPTAHMTSQVLKWMKKYNGSDSETHLNKMCYHAYRTLPLDICEDDFCIMLNSDGLWPSPEIDIYKTALKWIEHNNASVNIKRRVVGTIRFGLMTKKQMDEVFKSLFVPGCEVELSSAMRYHLNPHCQPLVVGDVNKMRLGQPEVYILGGLDEVDNYISKVLKSQVLLQHGNILLSPFTVSGKTPFALSESACTEVNRFIFVSGGEGASGAVNTLFRFNCRTNSWLQLSQMHQKRQAHTLTAVGDTVVSVGGWHMDVDLNSVESYDISNNTWTVFTPLPEKRAEHAASFVDNALYITGGSLSKTLYVLSDNIWTEKSSMLHVRQCHAMIGVSGRLIVA